MPKIIVDFTEAVEFDRTPVPAGNYCATIDASFAEEVKQGQEKKTPYITLGFRITKPEDYAGKLVFSNYMLAGKGSGGLKKLLYNLNFYTGDEDAGPKLFDTSTLHGIDVNIRVRMRTTVSGEEANEVVLVVPADTSA